MGYLEDIGRWTAGEVARRRETRHFAAAIAGEGLSIIAELKRASPSQGTILRDANPVAIAKAYEAGGAAAISVLTSERDFGGTLADLEAVRRAVDVPLLCKDFFVDPWQVVEARTHGADAILVIMALVTDELALELQQQADDLEMDVLCEVHDEEQLRRALSLGFPIVGVNARDLETMQVDRAAALKLLRSIPAGYVRIAESGIDSRAAATAARDAGANACLVGTALMREPGLLQELTGL
jgi:indole-3-glycerol phosphate synthase